MGKFKYNPGDKLGENQIVLLERTTKAKDGHWKGKFQCPYCSNIFETKISSVSGNITKSCGCLKKTHCIEIGHNNAKILQVWEVVV